MGYQYKVIANSAGSKGSVVSLDAKRKENFISEDESVYFYAMVMAVWETANAGIDKIPGMGDLWIYSDSTDEDTETGEEAVPIATFTKGSWEFVRVIT